MERRINQTTVYVYLYLYFISCVTQVMSFVCCCCANLSWTSFELKPINPTLNTSILMLQCEYKQLYSPTTRKDIGTRSREGALSNLRRCRLNGTAAHSCCYKRSHAKIILVHHETNKYEFTGQFELTLPAR